MKIPNVTYFLLTTFLFFSPFILGNDASLPKSSLINHNPKNTYTFARPHDNQCVLRVVGDKTHRNRHAANSCDNGEKTGGVVERKIIADKSRRNLLLQ